MKDPINYLQASPLAIYPWQQSQWDLLTQRNVQSTIPSAMILQGYKGLGKLDFAKQWALSMLCQQPGLDGRACGDCRQCLLAQHDGHPDCYLIQPEEDSTAIKIDQIRLLTDRLHETAQCKTKKVAIIEPAENMNRASANCLLKILEEPPLFVHIIIISHNPYALLPTLRSRCQFIKFYPSYDALTLTWLKAKSTVTDEQIGSAHLQSEGCPLTSLQFINEGFPENRLAILKEFYQVFLQQLDPVLLSEKHMKNNGLTYLDTILDFMAALIRYSTTRNEMHIIYKELTPIFNILSEKISLTSLYTYVDKLSQYRQFILTKINCNLQLLLEDIMISWFLLNRGN